MRFTQVCPCVNKRVSRLRGVNVSCIHLSCQENCWRMVNSMGKLMFVSDNRNQFTKLENFGKMFSFSQKEKQDDCFFWINAFVRKRTFYSIFGEEVIRAESKPRNMVRKGLFKAAYHRFKPWSNILQFFTKIIFRTILFEFAFYSIHIFKSCLEGVSFYGNLLLFMDKSYRFDWICEFRHSLSWVGRQSSKPLCSQLC